MNKNIYIASFICAIFASVYLGKIAIATPANLQLVSKNFRVQSNNLVSSNNFNSELKENSTKIILAIALITTGVLFGYLSQSGKGNKSSFQAIDSKSNTALLDRVSPKLRRQLLRLINDPKTANRLLMGIYKNNSDRSPNWLAEKAIYDLRRGR